MKATQIHKIRGQIQQTFCVWETFEPADGVARAFPSVRPDALVDAGVLTVGADDSLRAALDIRPHADDVREYLVVSDQDSAMRAGPVAADHVLGIGGASVSLARAVIRTPVGRALDIGTGCGIQALHLDNHCDEIVATDTDGNEKTIARSLVTVSG